MKTLLIKIQEIKLEFFTFVLKMIVSQQISDNLAEKIWGNFCSILKCKDPNIQKIKSKYSNRIKDSLKYASSTSAGLCTTRKTQTVKR